MEICLSSDAVFFATPRARREAAADLARAATPIQIQWVLSLLHALDPPLANRTVDLDLGPNLNHVAVIHPKSKELLIRHSQAEVRLRKCLASHRTITSMSKPIQKSRKIHHK